jgi:cytochrome b subunit of formate dehydrogenase
VTDLGLVTGATCSDCHTPHGNLPADDPSSSVNAANLRETCGKCHGVVQDAFLSFDTHNDPTDPHDNPKVYSVWRFMTVLLFSVFGFFGVHDLLWLQRSLVGVLRREFNKSSEEEGAYIRRFSSVHVRTHIVVIITFLVLAATGLPLKFYTAPWAQPLVGIFGDVETTRLLHRLAALATFGYAAFHLGHLFFRSILKKERGLFWGADSMVPQPKDVSDFIVNLKYFLYFGRRPSIGRWAYWEKFDYLAVFWGILVIGASGLILWQPNLFARFMPGWTLNAAYVIHSEEALLATGFIFIFHFFHTHLRPESFPMDPVMFTGRMPLKKFRVERPLEYRRLLENGTLYERLVPVPTLAERRNAYFLGVVATIIGIMLTGGIIWALLGR